MIVSRLFFFGIFPESTVVRKTRFARRAAVGRAPPLPPPQKKRKRNGILGRFSSNHGTSQKRWFLDFVPTARRTEKEIFDEGQRRRLASLGQKFLRTFRRERSRDWLPNRGGDRQLSIVYGPSSPWGRREALRLQREENKQFEKVSGTVAAAAAAATAKATQHVWRRARKWQGNNKNARWIDLGRCLLPAPCVWWQRGSCHDDCRSRGRSRGLKSRP